MHEKSLALRVGDGHECSNNQMVTKIAHEEICYKYMHILPKIAFIYIRFQPDLHVLL